MTSADSQVGRAKRPPLVPYRPAIDGLRAVAVIAVVAYHLSPSWLPGGFLGVDVFFVISGFLIGSLLLRSIESGSFSFRKFYWRRFRRLAPALFLVLTATGLVALIVYSPNELARFAGYLLAAVFGVSNLRFIFDNPYDAVEAGTNPLLHTWSLGVEEQFYLLIPLVLLLVGGWSNRRRLFGVLLFGFGISFASVFVLPGLLSIQVNFFSPLSRAWELLAGVLLAAWRPEGFALATRARRSMVSAAGLVLIGVSFLALGSLSTGPALLSLIPVIGSVLVIAAGEDNAVGKVLGSPGPVFVGLISYPLYLWHFPLFAYWELLGGQDPLVKVGLAGVAIVLATVTYLAIEKPIRRTIAIPRWLPLVIGGVVASTTVAVAALTTGGIPQRVVNMPVVEAPKFDDGPNTWTEGTTGEPVLLLGDSHMRSLIGPFIDYAEENDRTFASFTEAGCQFLLGIEKADQDSGNVDPRCTLERQQERLDWANSFGPSTVIVGGRLPMVLSGDRFNNHEGGDEGNYSEYFRLPGTKEYVLGESARLVADATGTSIQALLDAGHRVVIVYPIPEAGWHVPDELFRRSLLSGFTWPPETPLTTSHEVFRERTREARSVLDAITGPGIERVYPEELFCDVEIPGRCVTHSATEIFYEDRHHPSLVGARMIVELIMTGR